MSGTDTGNFSFKFCLCIFNVQYTILSAFQMEILLWVGEGGVSVLSVWDRPGTHFVFQAGLKLVAIFLTWPSAIFQMLLNDQLVESGFESRLKA